MEDYRKQCRVALDRSPSFFASDEATDEDSGRGGRREGEGGKRGSERGGGDEEYLSSTISSFSHFNSRSRGPSPSPSPSPFVAVVSEKASTVDLPQIRRGATVAQLLPRESERRKEEGAIEERGGGGRAGATAAVPIKTSPSPSRRQLDDASATALSRGQRTQQNVADEPPLLLRSGKTAEQQELLLEADDGGWIEMYRRKMQARSHDEGGAAKRRDMRDHSERVAV